VAEAEAASGEQRLRLAHQAARLGTWQWDIASGSNIWDERLEAMYGLPPGGFGGSFEAWMAMIHPDDVPEVLDVVERAMADRSSYVLNTRVVWPDGSVHSIEAWGQVTVDATGEPTGTIGCVRDVTEEVEAREALARALTARDRAATRMEFLLDVGAEFSTTNTAAEVAHALRFQLERFRRLFASGATVDVPTDLTSVRTGRDLVGAGYDRLPVPDQVLLDGLAAQCGVAAQRADLLARTAQIAEQLQLSLAASPLPVASAVDVAVHYAPGGSELEHVGGDWYDVIDVAEGGLSVIIGDVMGRGVRAATTMIRVRAGLRALVGDGAAPDLLLAQADDLVLRDAPDQFVTTAVATIRPDLGRVRVCSAGHVPVLVVQPDGDTRWLGDGSGIPLGIAPGQFRPTDSDDLVPGTLVVLVTDGVIEARDQDLGVGLRHLEELAVAGRTGPLPDLVARIAELADGSLRDDVTVVAARMR
jgi:PAS domain S-box-containing protein